MRMDKIEKVKNGLVRCSSPSDEGCANCPYQGDLSDTVPVCIEHVTRDALETIGTLETTIQEKDAQIASLRAQLDEAMLWR